MYLNVYVPMLQAGAREAWFFGKVRGNAVPSSPLMASMKNGFVAGLKRLAADTTSTWFASSGTSARTTVRGRTCATSRATKACCTSVWRRRRRAWCVPSAATTLCAVRTRGWYRRRRWRTTTTYVYLVDDDYGLLDDIEMDRVNRARPRPHGVTEPTGDWL